MPGPVRAGAHPPPERGPLPAAARARRSPPLRHHLPPRAAGQAHDPSVLDDIPGLGPVRKKRLVKELGGVGAVKRASLEDLLALAWLPDAVAEAVYDKIHAARRPADRPDDRGPSWEDHADWWQREFTDGVDPEYTEQILPLAEAWLAGFDRVLDIGTGEGQVARRLRQADGAAVVGHRSDRRPGRPRRSGAVAGSAYVRAGATALPFADALVRRGGGLPGVRAHRRPGRGASPRWPGCCGPAAASCCSSTIRCCRPPAAAGSTTRSSIRPSSTGASGRT